jgi:hypothetical protein
MYSGKPFDVSYRDAFLERDVGPNRPDVVGDPGDGQGDGRTTPWFDVTPIGDPNSPWARPAEGTFGDFERNALAGPWTWNVDASAFKRIEMGGARSLELRLEVLNLFNHVSLGTPNSEIGTLDNPNPDAGLITSTSDGWQARNLQFALRFQF